MAKRTKTKKPKPTKFIWLVHTNWHGRVNAEKWKVEKVLRPTKYDTYLLVSQVDKERVHDDKTHTVPVLMHLIDCDNDTFYLDTKAVRDHIARVNAISKKLMEEEAVNDDWDKWEEALTAFNVKID